jgi:sodium transport system permease protein
MLIVLPMLMFPVFIGLTTSFIASHEARAQQSTISVAVFMQGNQPGFTDYMITQESVDVMEVDDQETARRLVQHDSLDAYIVFARDFDAALDSLGTGHVDLCMKVTEDKDIQRRRLLQVLNGYTDVLRNERFESLGMDVSICRVTEVETVNLATAQEQIADIAGGILPYMFVLFCFMGAMYPAIDLAAGEKERGTLETLLTSPVSKMQILVGKVGVVILTGISSAAISFLGLFFGVRYISSIPPELFDMVISILKPGTIIFLLTLLFPLTVFFASLMLSLSFTARSYKEAQSKIGPMTPVVIIPAFIGMMPGIGFNAMTAVIPILNVTLATKQIIAGHTNPLLIVLVYASLVVYAAIGLMICSRTFSRESVIFG